MKESQPSRRAVLRASGATGLALALGAWSGQHASAVPTLASTPTTTVTDLGPGLLQFSLMSSVVVGDYAYIGSRNVEPARVVAFHLPTHKVVARTDVPTGYTIQAMAADPTGRYLYFGVLQKDGGPQNNLYRWDLGDLTKPATSIGRMGDRDVRDITVAPDGVVFAVGGGSPTAPALWEYSPATGLVSNRGIPAPSSTLARAVAATRTTVFFGGGSTLGGGGNASRASLFAYDRAAATFADVTPDEMVGDPSMRELAVIGDRLVAGSAGATSPAKIAIMDLAGLSSYRLTTLTGAVTKMYAAHGDTVYYAATDTLESISLSTARISPVPYDGPSLGEIWGVDVRGDTVVAVSGYGFVAEVTPATGAYVVTDLGEAGAPVDAQAVMGIAAGGGYAYVGGNGAMARHSLSTGEVLNLRMPGEAKDAEVLDGILYTGQYNSMGIWRYDPRDGQAPRQAAHFPTDQNRPLDTQWDPVNRLLLVAVQRDTEGGGALWTYDPRTGAAANVQNPIDAAQLVRAVATRDGIAYLGGDNAQPTGPRGTVVAFDPVRRKELWRLETNQGYGIGSLVVHGRYLYGMALKGGFFVIDLELRKVVHTANLRPVCPQWSAMLLNRGRIYAVSDTTLMRFDPKTFAMEVVVPQLNGGWYSGCHVNSDEAGRLYTLRGRNLVVIDDRP
ncbi:hypothetical protein JOF29_007264 [Kribbella aluminosa]|uniref:PQQ-binding-like beta-propeller repeat protein n=1 Tax=Kribbella aluminosa TaxID=416017 RepID=A0ABS4UXA3_9ACTN|nr:hypothetical protein [Kribbella aluminosa]MBP2356154.1 hypothetical protein [Kribbella aluminosa]